VAEGIALAILGSTDGSYERTAAPREEELGIAVLKPGTAGRVDAFLALGQQGRHPHGVIPVDAPREGQEGTALGCSTHLTDVDSVYRSVEIVKGADSM
jgi:hypothetical protein